MVSTVESRRQGIRRRPSNELGGGVEEKMGWGGEHRGGSQKLGLKMKGGKKTDGQMLLW